MDSENKEVIAIEDFNCDWSCGKDKLTSHTKTLVDLTEKYHYEPLIKQSTRTTETSSTLIVLAFSNRPEIVVDSGVEHIGINDHSMIYVSRKVSIPRNKPKTINTRQYKNFDMNDFRSDLNRIFQTQTSNSYSPNILWEEWKEKILLVADLHAPKIT